MATAERLDESFDLSVVIVSWNTCKLLEDCLRSVYASFQGVRAEVWVVDNASSDDSVAMAQQQFPQTRLIVNSDNRGFAVANNQALVQCAGRYLLLLNSDTVVPVGALDALVAVMDTHPEVGVCGPLLLNADGSPQLNWARFPGLASEMRRGQDRSQSPYPIEDFASATKRAAMQPFVVDWIGGACFMVRHSAVESVGLLDEGYFMYSEETDWCHRWSQAGWKTLLAPQITVTHLGGQSSSAVPIATRTRMWRSSLRLYRKMYGPVQSAFPCLLASARYYLARLSGGISKRV
jgi:hypothetical protein